MGLTFTVSRLSCCLTHSYRIDHIATVYYMQSISSEAQFAQELHERVRREFPEVLIIHYTSLHILIC